MVFEWVGSDGKTHTADYSGGYVISVYPIWDYNKSFIFVPNDRIAITRAGNDICIKDGSDIVARGSADNISIMKV